MCACVCVCVCACVCVCVCVCARTCVCEGRPVNHSSRPYRTAPHISSSLEESLSKLVESIRTDPDQSRRGAMFVQHHVGADHP